MAIVPVASGYGSLVELEDIGNSLESMGKHVESQRELFHSQIDQLQKIVVTQCRLTGVNPLSQEMAAGALSINIGKKPRDLLNPKAMKYMQSLFSIKDTIGKKETREISALCGITATQVRDYFAGQRSRVRKLVRLSKEKAIRTDASKETIDASKGTIDGCTTTPNRTDLANEDVPFNNSELSTPSAGNSENVTPVCMQDPITPVNINSIRTQPSGNLVYVGMPNPENSSNITTLCTAVPGASGNFSVVPVVSGNFTTVCTAVPGVSGNVTTLCTPVPGNMRFVTPVLEAVPLNSISGPPVGTLVNGNPLGVSTVQNGQPIPLRTNLKPEETGALRPLPEENTPGIDNDDKKFLENIFNLMRKEQTFAGQVKLMEWVLQINNSAVLNWFSTKGGITILSTWLSQAALEEQTTVLLVIFKVLCHLPLNKAQPVQMSAILQTVNKLRFYRNSDISNRAKILLSRWSKMFVRSQALRNSSKITPKNGQKEILKQRTSGVGGDESLSSNLDIPEEILALAQSTEDSRDIEPKKAVMLLTESGEGSSKKHGRSVSATNTKERRKVLLVEQPDSKAGRSIQVAKAVPSKHSRPMSADDIQKAKMRAIFMQDKYGKSNSATSETNNPEKSEDHKAVGDSLPVKQLPLLPQPRRAEVKNRIVPSTKSLSNNPEISMKPKLNKEEQLREKLKRNQIRWCTPPEIRISASWRVGSGENSKEVHVQNQRNKREKETFYQNPQDIPPNPKHPWDIEMDFDDSLTPEIPIDQPPDSETPVETAVEDHNVVPATVLDNTALNSSVSTSTMVVDTLPEKTSEVVGPAVATAEPDAELLQVLLRNPEVVEALTKGEGRNLSEEQLVALLDMVKKAGSTGLGNGTKIEPSPDPEPTSLPSPTPPSDAERIAWRSSALQPPQFSGNRGATTIVPTIPPRIPSPTPMPMAINNQSPVPMVVNNTQMLTSGLPSQAPTTFLSLPHPSVTHFNSTPQQPIPNLLPTKPPSMYVPSRHSPSPETYLPSTNNHHLYQVNNNPPVPSIHPSQWKQPPPMSEPPVAYTGYFANDNNHNTTNNSHNMYGRRNGYIGRAGTETWNSENSPVRSPEFQYEQPNYLELRREFEMRGEPEWSRQRQWNSGQQNEYRTTNDGGGGRWRDRGGGRGREY